MAAITGEDFSKSGIVISPLDAPTNIQGASYDFRIGDQIWLWSERKTFDPSKEQVILRRNDIAVIQTYETVTMPADACGILINKVAPHAMGIFHPSTSIDPLFDGHMQVALFNLGRHDVPLKWKADLGTAMFFKMTSPTQIHFSRTQDFSRLIEVFAKYFDIMYPERREVVPPSVSLEELKEEVVWRGYPFISLYSFLAGHERQLGKLQHAVRNQFLMMMSGPWLLGLAAVGLLMAFVYQSWEQVQPIAVTLGIVSASANLVTLGIRWWRGRRLK